MNYLYVKKTEPDQLVQAIARVKDWWRQPTVRRAVSYLLVTMGVLLIGNGVLPIVNYQIRYAPGFAKIHSPVPEQERSFLLGSPLAAAEEEGKDYTLISSWFVDEAKVKKVSSAKIIYYNLSIPKLKVDDAVVYIGGEDLKKSLIHYSETAMPGSYGNTVVFGHSVLPQFFDPNNYLTIFSTLYKLGKNDDILVYYDGIEYRYKVESLFEVSPNDLSVLEQRFDGKYLTLITCSPPGTYLRRLIIRAKLEEY